MKEVFLVNCDASSGFFEYSIGFNSEEDAEKCKSYLTHKSSYAVTNIRKHHIFDSFESFLEMLEKCNAQFLFGNM